MRYHDFLNTLIKNSGLSLTKIAELLRDRGYSVDKAYLSKLKNGKLPPAKEDFNEAIADILNGDTAKLISYGYLENAPEEFKELLSEVNNIDELLDNSFTTIFSSIQPHQIIDSDSELGYFLLQREFNMYDSEAFIKKATTELSTSEKWNLFIYITKDVKVYKNVDQANDKFDLIFDFTNLKPKKKLNKIKVEHNEDTNTERLSLFTEDEDIEVPILKNIFAGYIYEAEDIKGSMTIKHTSINNKDGFILSAHNEKMNLDGIHKDDLVLIQKQASINSHEEIVCLCIRNNPAVLARLQEYEDKYLIKYNNVKEEIEVVDKNAVNILGKAVQVMSTRPL
ncbi:LexA family transcriptional regulator [Fictibacillus phosphorivorans]|uniref:LexA family transcriptional regulator n=1 Tax=Fictibacillus phosphorivorans TaxID=1221500 RepID=UPI0018857EE4|nr:S24 family peptidase [Fictibacillus phosphorivorans]